MLLSALKRIVYIIASCHLFMTYEEEIINLCVRIAVIRSKKFARKITRVSIR